jgi:hypothetical protein
MPKPRSARPSKPTLIQDEKRISLAEHGLLQGMQKLSPYLDEMVHNNEQPAVIPRELYNSLAMLGTIAHCGIPAQNAQRVHGGPASFLIADHITYYGFCQIPPLEEGERFAGERHFLNEARRLATSRKFQPALELAASPVAYARRLHELGFFEHDVHLLDVVSRITAHDLFECDWRYAAKKPPYEVTVDEAAAFLSERPESIRFLLESGVIMGLIGGKVLYQSLFSYAQRHLARKIESELLARCPARTGGLKRRPVPATIDVPEASNLVMFHGPQDDGLAREPKPN